MCLRRCASVHVTRGEVQIIMTTGDNVICADAARARDVFGDCFTNIAAPAHILVHIIISSLLQLETSLR